MDLRGRSLLEEIDLPAGNSDTRSTRAPRLRLERRMGERMHRLAGRNITLAFQKASTLTRTAFEVAAHDEGAHVSYIGPG